MTGAVCLTHRTAPWSGHAGGPVPRRTAGTIGVVRLPVPRARARRALGVLGLLAVLAVTLVAALLPDTEPRYREQQCTAWVHGKRPDMTRGTAGLRAGAWERWARARGYAVDTRPRAGDVAAWSANIGAGPDGHVAYVELIGPGGAVFVSERNVDGCTDVSYVRLTPERLSTAVFIHAP